MRRLGRALPLDRDLGIGLALVALFAVIPWLGPSKYVVSQITLFFIWATVVTQWNLIFGFAGIFSLAQMAVFGMGAYTAAMLALYLDWSLWGTMFLGGLMSVLVGAIIGAACIRLSGPFVALLTLAVAVVMQQMIVTDFECFYKQGMTCYNFTGGPRGLSRFGDFNFKEWLGYGNRHLGSYYLGLVILAAATAFTIVVKRSSMGLAFVALRDNPVLAKTRGINRSKYQILIFTLSAFFTGLAGGFYAGHFRTVSPPILDLSIMLFLLTMMVVGGLGRRWGPLLGCAAIMLIDDALKDAAEWRMIGIGAISILFILVIKGGIAGFIELAVGRLRRQM